MQKLGFEVGPYPDLSVVTYHYVPPPGIDSSEFNQKLVKEVQMDGRVFISSTKLGNKFMLRMAALSHRTHLSTVNTLLQVLKEKVEQLLKTCYQQQNN